MPRTKGGPVLQRISSLLDSEKRPDATANLCDVTSVMGQTMSGLWDHVALPGLRSPTLMEVLMNH